MMSEDEQICCLCGESCTTGYESAGQVVCMPCFESVEDFAASEAEKDANASDFLDENGLDGFDLDSGEFY